MNANELREKTPDQLREELASLKKESFNLRFQQATGQLENTLVVVTGEFGRTPYLMKQDPPGRQHWPRCFSSIIAIHCRISLRSTRPFESRSNIKKMASDGLDGPT